MVRRIWSRHARLDYQGEPRRRYRQNDDYIGPYYRPYR